MTLLVLVGRHKLASSASRVLRPNKKQVWLSPAHLPSLRHDPQDQKSLPQIFGNHRSFSSSKNPPSSAPRGGGDSDEGKERQHSSSNISSKNRQSNNTESNSTPKIPSGSRAPPADIQAPRGGREASFDRLKNDGTKKEWLYNKHHQQHEKLQRDRQRHRAPPSKRNARPTPLQVPVISQSNYYYYHPPSSSSRMKMRPGTATVSSTQRSSSDDNSSNTSTSQNRRIVALPAVNAAAFLNPKKYSKVSSTPAAGSAAVTHGVSKSISGTDAMRRLLRGKKEFVQTVRNQLLLPEQHQSQQKQLQKQQQGDRPGGGGGGKSKHIGSAPAKAALLTGHGVPIELLQHFIDMGDAFLNHYDDAAEFSFHNYTNQKKQRLTASNTPSIDSEWRASQPPSPSPIQLPQVVRIRNSDATNRCTKWPPSAAKDEEVQSNLSEIAVDDWNHHLSLYLAAMERIAGKLATVLTRENPMHKRYPPDNDDNNNNNDDGDDDDFTSSPLLFPNASNPDWTVDIMRGSYYDLHSSSSSSSNSNSSNSNISSSTTKHTTTAAPPVPIVEWVRGNNSLSTLGHVLIRIQGHAKENDAFLSSAKAKNQGRPVSLVFDACFRTEIR